jgi:hypothetical protein
MASLGIAGLSQRLTMSFSAILDKSGVMDMGGSHRAALIEEL